MRLGCSTYLDPALNVDASLKRLRALGFRRCDLFAFEGVGHFDPSWLRDPSRQAGRRLREALARSGLQMSAINCGLGQAVNDPDARAAVETAFRALLDLAVEVDCPLLTVQTGGVAPGQDPEEALARAEEGLRRLAALAGAAGVRLTFEPHQGAVVEDPAVARRLVEALWPQVGIAYDPSHFVMQEIPLEATAPLLDYTTHVHVRNAAPGQMQAPLARGTVDFPWLVAAWRQRGYAGPVVLEYLGAGEADVVALRDRLISLGLEL